jgi:hypothetical protein
MWMCSASGDGRKPDDWRKVPPNHSLARFAAAAVDLGLNRQDLAGDVPDTREPAAHS